MKIYSIGRTPDNDIVINDSYVSRQHAQLIIADDGQVMIKDLGSSNGTFVNGNRVTECYLKPGDVVKCASVFLDWQEYLKPTMISPPPIYQDGYQSQAYQHKQNIDQPNLQVQGNIVRMRKGKTVRVAIALGLSLAAFLLIILVSCNDLTRWKAKRQITEKFKFPIVESVKISKSYLIKSWGDRSGFLGIQTACLTLNWEDYSNSKDMLNYFVNKGFLTLRDEETYQNECHFISKEVIPTEEARKHLIKETNRVYEFKTSELIFEKITGIVEYEKLNTAEVQYILGRKNFTPFGEYFSKDKPLEEKENAQFTKYDNGWRIN